MRSAGEYWKGQELKELVIGYAEQTMDDIVEAYINPELPPEEWKLPEMVEKMKEFVYLLSDVEPEHLENLSLVKSRPSSMSRCALPTT
jgi:preprotein translocase subunit SecA